MSQAFDDLKEKIKQECLTFPDNEAVFKALTRSLRSKKPSKLFKVTRNDVWECGLKQLIHSTRHAQRDALKCDVLRAHVKAGGIDLSGKSKSPYAKDNMVGPSARVRVHNRMAVHRMKNTWDLVYFGKQVKDMTWDDLDGAIRRLEPSAISTAANVHWFRVLQTRLTSGTSDTVLSQWHGAQVDAAYAAAINHAHTAVKQAI